jgi:hypothetical protein
MKPIRKHARPPAARRKGAGIALRLLLALALVAISFAHRPATTLADSAQLQAQFVLPDGSYPSLCIAAGEEDGGMPHVCEFCLIAGGAMPSPQAASTFLAHAGGTAIAVPSHASGHRVAALRKDAPVRGPPLAA